MRKKRVRALLMGGQACVLYGAAEFSRDTDLAILAEPANLQRLKRALVELKAEVIAVPPFEIKYLRRGHAIHFRLFHPEAMRMRLDVMAKMRGVDSFSKLWRRRTTIELAAGETCDLLSLPDLVRAKKTQRDKDWPMIRRLVEANYFQNSVAPNAVQIGFWLLELRTPEVLIEAAKAHSDECNRLISKRPLLRSAAEGKLENLRRALVEEENQEREKDRKYWSPLRSDLEKLRHSRLRS
jgi:hypothetical protein